MDRCECQSDVEFNEVWVSLLNCEKEIESISVYKYEVPKVTWVDKK